MAQQVTSDRVPYIPITLEIPEPRTTLALDALVDTGFSQGIALPAELLPAARSALAYETIRLADGSRRSVPVYAGRIRIAETLIDLAMVFELGDEPIIGLDIISRFRVILDRGQSISFEA